MLHLHQTYLSTLIIFNKGYRQSPPLHLYFKMRVIGATSTIKYQPLDLSWHVLYHRKFLLAALRTSVHHNPERRS